VVSEFDWISLISILLIAVAGGYFPLARRESARTITGFPMGQAFAAGVFLALSLFIMLPNGFHLFAKAFPNTKFPLAAAFAAGAYVLLLAVGHLAYAKRAKAADQRELTTPVIPIIMTIMIAIPSFLLGTALGVSETASAIVIFVAIMAHKGSAGFALALSMVRSTMTKAQTFGLYGVFAVSTPLGILVGADVHQYLVGHTMLVVKASILSLASGVFLYMATLHEMKHSPLIVDCCTPKGFVSMVAGLILTALVRYALGIAHSGHPG
jgi:solute carrier family 39 (zinc transporter), member 1/2/3